MAKMTNLLSVWSEHLKCDLTHIQIDVGMDRIAFFVPQGHRTNFSTTIAYAKFLLPSVKAIMVTAGTTRWFYVYADGEWECRLSKRMP